MDDLEDGRRHPNNTASFDSANLCDYELDECNSHYSFIIVFFAKYADKFPLMEQCRAINTTEKNIKTVFTILIENSSKQPKSSLLLTF